MHEYQHRSVEERWQEYWDEHQTFRAANPGDADFRADRPKYYVLDMFPYPSGAGLHVGHPIGYIATDIVSRFKRMRGFNVLHPIGWDAFGLPAEQYAIEHKVHPRTTTDANIANMARQLKKIGLSYDWSREIATTDTNYYRWTQWIFVQFFNHYCDPQEHKAVPIADLVSRLETGDCRVCRMGAALTVDFAGKAPASEQLEWKDLTAENRREVLDSVRLAFMAETEVNWCPALGTVLANEEITNDGRSERGNHLVYKRPLKQWMLRITDYAERLLSDLELVDWPESTKMMQRNWIGRSEGARVWFSLAGHAETVEIFTTRPDTLFGATYLVLAPEHPLVELITPPENRADVDQYLQRTASLSDIDRKSDERAVTGVFTGAYAKNPVNGQPVPVWIADYVLMGYGTGAIMAVPAHDARDFKFAQTFDIPMIPVVLPDDQWLQEFSPETAEPRSPEELREIYEQNPAVFREAFCGHGTAINSRNETVSLDGEPTPQAQVSITRWLSEQGIGRSSIQYKLRDWLFSRQRYWGEPIPIVHAPSGEMMSVDESSLPVELPEVQDFSPTPAGPDSPPRPPLAHSPDSWLTVAVDGVLCERELNTMPQWAGSCWYYLRYCDPQNSEQLVGSEAEKYWMQQGQSGTGGVDLYVGGVEHAVLHLLYARFWHKFLYDLKVVSSPEPFQRLYNQGYMQAFAYLDERGIYVPAEEVEERDTEVDFVFRDAGSGDDNKHRTRFFYQDQPVLQKYGKMGKSLKNAIAPDEICDQYGADTLRLYEMYLGPLDQHRTWRTRDIVGVNRFLKRLWQNLVDRDGNLKISEDSPDAELARQLNRMIADVTDDVERLRFNTAIARIIELNNLLTGRELVPREVGEAMVLVLSPFAPHFCEELWSRLRPDGASLAYEPWPEFDPKLLEEDEDTYPVQVNGKLRSTIRVPAGSDQATVEKAAREDEKVAAYLAKGSIKRVIFVPSRLINIVVK